MSTDRTIRITYPLALSIAGPLCQAIGTLWPGAMVSTTESDALVMTVPDKGPQRLTKKAAREILGADDHDHDGAITRSGPGKLTVTPDDAWDELALFAYVVLTASGAINYVEREVTDRETGERFVVIAARSPGQTPHVLRMKAERGLQEANAGAWDEGYRAGYDDATDMRGCIADNPYRPEETDHA